MEHKIQFSINNSPETGGFEENTLQLLKKNIDWINTKLIPK